MFDKPIKLILYFYLLHQGPNTGYEIGKQFSEAIKNNLWDVPETKNLQHPTKLYPILAEMENDWLIISAETQNNKKEYTINPYVLFNTGTQLGKASLKAISFPLFENKPGFKEKMESFGFPLPENYRDNISYWKTRPNIDVYFFNPYIETLSKAALPPQEFIRRSNSLFSKTKAPGSLWLVLYFRDLLGTLTNPEIQGCIGHDDTNMITITNKESRLYKHFEFSNIYLGSGSLQDRLNMLPIDPVKYAETCKKESFDQIKIDSFSFNEKSLLEETKDQIKFHIDMMINDYSPLSQLMRLKVN